MEEEIIKKILENIKMQLENIRYHNYDNAVKQSEIIKNLSIAYKVLVKEEN